MNIELFEAARLGNCEGISYCLLSKHTNINFRNLVWKGATALFAAVTGGHEAAVNLLIEKGADVNLANSDGWGPLHIASEKLLLSILRKLLESGANLTAECVEIARRQPDSIKKDEVLALLRANIRWASVQNDISSIHLLSTLYENFPKLQSATDREIVLFLGNMRSGKSTTINYLLDHKLKSVPLRSDSPGMVIEVEGNAQAEIGHGNLARTYLTHVFPHNRTKLCYCDSPGFLSAEGFRGACEALHIRMTIALAKRVKAIALVISYAELIAVGGRLFVDLMNRLTVMIPDIVNGFTTGTIEGRRVADSLVFVITKVPGEVSLSELCGEIEQHIQDAEAGVPRNEEDMQKKAALLLIMRLMRRDNFRRLIRMGNAREVDLLNRGEARDHIIRLLRAAPGIERAQFNVNNMDGINFNQMMHRFAEYASPIIYRKLAYEAQIQRITVDVNEIERTLPLYQQAQTHQVYQQRHILATESRARKQMELATKRDAHARFTEELWRISSEDLVMYHRQSMQTNWFSAVTVGLYRLAEFIGIDIDGLRRAATHQFRDDGSGVLISEVREDQVPAGSGRFDRHPAECDATRYHSTYHIGAGTDEAFVEFRARIRDLYGNPERIRQIQEILEVLNREIAVLEREIIGLGSEIDALVVNLSADPGILARVADNLDDRIRAVTERRTELHREMADITPRYQEVNLEYEINREFLKATVEVTRALRMEASSELMRSLIENWGELIATHTAEFFPEWHAPGAPVVDARLPFLRRVWGDESTEGTQPGYEATGIKLGGASIGAIYEERRMTLAGIPYDVRWIGKIGWPDEDTASRPAPLHIGTNVRNCVSEKIAADIYYLLSYGKYFMPETRLASMRIRNQYTESHPIFPHIVAELGDGDSMFFMMKFVESYQDLEKLINCYVQGERASFTQFLARGLVPETVEYEGIRLPITGLMSLLAVARLLSDIDVLGGSARNAGFVIERRSDGTAQAIRIVNIDPGESFAFTRPENNVFNRRLMDLRDIQFGTSMPQAIIWDRLTLVQREEFSVAFTQGLRILNAPGFLDFIIMRSGLFNRVSVAVTHTSQKRFTERFASWLLEQTELYAPSFLFDAARAGNLEAAQALLSNTMVDINAQHTDFGGLRGKTALFIASEMGHLNVVKLLVSNGARLDIPDAGGWTVLRVAEHLNRFDVVAYLRAVLLLPAEAEFEPALPPARRVEQYQELVDFWDPQYDRVLADALEHSRREFLSLGGGDVLGEQIRTYGLELHDVPNDGNCFFHAIFDQLTQRYPEILAELGEVFATEVTQQEIRQLAVGGLIYSAQHGELDGLVEGGVDNYIAGAAIDRTWADGVIIPILARVLGVTLILINSDGNQPTVIHGGNRGTLYLGYQVGIHFESAIIRVGQVVAPALIDHIRLHQGGDPVRIEPAVAVAAARSLPPNRPRLRGGFAAGFFPEVSHSLGAGISNYAESIRGLRK